MLNYSVRGQTVHLYPKDIEYLPILLPPREFQDSISNKLKQAIEAKIEAEKKKKDIIDTLEEEFNVSWDELYKYKKVMGYVYSMKDSISQQRIDPCFYHPFYRELSRQLRKNKKLNIDILRHLTMTKIVNGTTPKKELKPFTNDKAGVPFIRNGDIKKGLLLYDIEKGIKIRKDLFDKFRNISVKAGDVLLSMTGTLGDACVIPPEIEAGIINQNVVRIRFNDYCFSHYFVEYLLYIGKYFMFQMSTGQIQEYLNTMILERLPVTYPKEQDKILKICKLRKEFLQNLNSLMQLRSRAMEEFNNLLGLNSGGDKS